LLEVLLEQIGPHGLEVVAQEVAEPEALGAGEVGLALEHAPAGLLKEWLVAVLGEPACLGGAHVVEGVIHLGDDVKAIENVQRVGAAFVDDPQVGLPHVRADELDAFGQRLADEVEELLEAFDGAILADP